MTARPLISAAELRAALGERDVLDVRYRMGGPAGHDEFAAGHVPGAAYVDLDTDLAAPPGRRRSAPAAGPERASRRRCARPGSSTGRPVVVYDDWDGRAAARAWWLLRYHGHPDVQRARRRLAGLVAGRRRRRDRDAATPAPRRLHGQRRQAMPVVEADGVPASAVLVDARAPERYRGEVEPIDPVAGHIPGAVNVPTERNLDADGRFRVGRRAAGDLRRGRRGRRRRRGGVLRLGRDRRPRRAGDGGGRRSARRSTPAAGAAGSPTPTAARSNADRATKRLRGARHGESTQPGDGVTSARP